MPCRDWTVQDEWNDKRERERGLVIAGLCAVLTALEEDDSAFNKILQTINWKEAGITKRELLLWWEGHKEKDAKRREAMAKQLREIKIRNDALAKLTDEEKKILGIK